MTVIDNNRIPALLAVSNADGSTVLPVYANASTNALKASDALTGSDLGGNPDPRDSNRKIAFFAVSAVDGVSPCAVYCDSVTNALLIRSS